MTPEEQADFLGSDARQEWNTAAVHSTRSLVLTGSIAAAAVAAVDAALTPNAGAGRPAAILGAIGLAAAFGALLGLAERGLLALFARPLRTLARGVDLQARTTRDPQASRGPVVELHASGAALAVSLLVVLGSAMLVFPALRRVQIQQLLETLILLVVGASAVTAIVIFVVVRRWLTRPIAALDSRRPLPLPASRELRRLLFLALPTGAIAIGVLVALGSRIGPFSVPLWVALVVAAQVPVWIIGARFGRILRARASLVALWTLLAAVVIGFVFTERALAKHPALGQVMEASRFASMLLGWARAATDADRDGVSSLFGGRDCAPFTATRSPWRTEIADNGIDENCDGRDDATGDASWPGEHGPRYWDGPVQSHRGHDVVLFVVDALRADHTSLHGYSRKTTPYLDRLGQESIVFTRALAHSSTTLFSMPAMFTGIDPGRLQWERGKGLIQLQQGHVTLAERLGNAGYSTGFVVSGFVANAMPGLFQGFQWVRHLDGAQFKINPTAAALAVSFIESARQRPQPYFLTVYMPGPHTPYVQQTDGYPVYGHRAIDKYDSEIAATDRYIGFVLDVLRQNKARWNRTVVIVTSDHGEEFGEHGGTEHARTCHVESLHVPLVLRASGVRPRRTSRSVGLTAIVPTLIELLELQRPADREIDGHSLLLEAFAPERVPLDHPLYCSVLSLVPAQGHFYRRSVRSGQWALFQELTGSGGIRLYDTQSDPGELSPLALEGEAAETARRLDAQLTAAMTGNLGSLQLTGQ